MKVSSNKRIARNTLFLYIRMLLTMAVSLYTSRVVLNVIGIEDYGVYTVVGGVVSLFSFFNSAMSSATQRFLAFDIGKNDYVNLKKTFNATLNIHIGIGLFITLLAETIGLWFVNNKLNVPVERMDAIYWVYQFSILTFLVGVVQVPYNALIIARERMSIYAVMSIVEVILKLLIVYLLLVFDADKLKLYAVLVFLVAFSIASFYRMYCHRHFGESKYQFHYDREMYKTLISYSGWNLFGNLAAVAKGQGTNIVLNLFFGPLINAAYGITMQVQGAVTVFVKNFQLAFNPQIIKTYAAGNKDKSLQLIFQSARFSFFLMLIIILPVIFSIEDILYLWLKNVPEYTSLFVVLCLINVLIDSISGPLMVGAQATGNIKWYQIVIGTLLLLNLPISYLFLEYNGKAEQVFLVSIIISLVAFIFRIFFLKRLIGLSIFDFIEKVVFKIIVVLIPVISFYCYYGKYLIFDQSWSNLLFNVSVYILLIFLSILLLGINRNERGLLRNVYNKIIKK